MSTLINKESSNFVEKMHEEFPEINMLAIWCELEGKDNKTCQHIDVDTAKVKGAMPKPHLPGFNYCGPFTKFNGKIGWSARGDN
jgi:hypothetical protein